MVTIFLIFLAAQVLAQEPIVTFDGTRAYIDGIPCRCVPQYLCNEYLQIIPERERMWTGSGQLDIRMGDEGCLQSNERCCVDPTICGSRDPSVFDPKAVNSNDKEARLGEFPWVVTVMKESVVGEVKVLGAGALIHPQVVITAGNVVNKDRNSDKLVIRAGELDTSNTDETLQHQQRKVQNIRVHEDFSTITSLNDVAVLRLERPVQVGLHVNTICLPRQDETWNHGSCFVSGWGKDTDKGQSSSILKRQQTNLISHRACSESLNRALFRLSPSAVPFHLTHEVTCSSRDSAEPCYDNGGAPLVCPTSDGRFKLAGLSSGSVLCSLQDIPFLYPSAFALRTWVDAKMAYWGYNDTAAYTV